MPRTKLKSRKQKPRARAPTKNRPRPQKNASTSIVRGLTGIANQFMPGAGTLLGAGARYLGFGAYSTAEAESLLASKVPTMHATLDRGVRISHHEYLGDVKSATDFSVLKYPINPGMPVTFPWLSSVAQAFQEYELNGMVFYFKATSANALSSTNTALGQIIGAVQYNPYLSDPTSKVIMLGLAGASDGKPSESNVYPVECKADMTLMRSKLIRVDTVTDDLAKYDHGNFFLGANGSQAVATVGEIHVVYDILLKKPKLWSMNTTGWTPRYHGAGVSSSNPIGTTVTKMYDNMGLSVSSYSVSIPAHLAVAGTKYRFTMHWTSGSTASIVYPSLTVSNLTLSQIYYVSGTGPISSITSPPNGTTTSSAHIEWAFTVDVGAVPVVISIGSCTIPGSADSWMSLTEVL